MSRRVTVVNKFDAENGVIVVGDLISVQAGVYLGTVTVAVPEQLQVAVGAKLLKEGGSWAVYIGEGVLVGNAASLQAAADGLAAFLTADAIKGNVPDTSSSTSRQHFVDTGRYLTIAEVGEDTGEAPRDYAAEAAAIRRADELAAHPDEYTAHRLVTTVLGNHCEDCGLFDTTAPCEASDEDRAARDELDADPQEQERAGDKAAASVLQALANRLALILDSTEIDALLHATYVLQGA